MKHKFYLLLFLSVIISPAFANLSVTINYYGPNPVHDYVQIEGKVTSTYTIAKMYAKMGGDSIPVNNANGAFGVFVSVLKAPLGPINITVYAEDVLHIKDSASITVIRDYPPTIKIPGGETIIRGPYLHMHAEAADEGDTKLEIIGPAPLHAVLAQGINVIDTTIDISDIITGFGEQYNIMQVLATDKYGQVTTQYLPPFTLLPSPYLKNYHEFEDSTSVTDFRYGKWLVADNHSGKTTSTLFDFNHGDSTIITTCCAASITETGVAINRSNGSRVSLWHKGALTNYPYKTYRYLAIKGKYAFFDTISPINFKDRMFRLNLDNGQLDFIDLTDSQVENFIYAEGAVDNDPEGDVVMGHYSVAFIQNGGHSYYDTLSARTTFVTLNDTPRTYEGQIAADYNRGTYVRDAAVGNHRFFGIKWPFSYNYTTNVPLYFTTPAMSAVIDTIREGIDIFKMGYYGGLYTKTNANTRIVSLFFVDSAGQKYKIDSSINMSINETGDGGEMLYGYGSGNKGGLGWANIYGAKKRLCPYVFDLHSKFYYNNGWYIVANGKYVYTLNLNATDSIAEIKREVKKDSAYNFKSSDFDKAFFSEGGLFEVKLTALPKHGMLYLENDALTVPDIILKHFSLKQLTYKPNAGYIGKDTLYWNGSTGDSTFIAHNTLIEMAVVEVLPVTLTNLKAEAVGKVNLLTWQTTQEVNSSYFEVQKSLDGSSFSPIGKVQAKGNSSITQNYSFSDGNPVPTAKNYYRLKVVDRDGKYSFTKIVWLKNTVSSAISLYPNPASNSMQVSLSNMAPGRCTITLYTIGGKAVYSRQYTVQQASQQVTVPVSNLAVGIYTVKVTGNNGAVVTSQKMVKE